MRLMQGMQRMRGARFSEGQTPPLKGIVKLETIYYLELEFLQIFLIRPGLHHQTLEVCF